jgi:anti-sigma28 factor (negative regulator of flagellin synthesis)
MAALKQGNLPPAESEALLNNERIDALKKKINNEEYLFEAIHRIAQVLSNEISGVSGGGSVERKGF